MDITKHGWNVLDRAGAILWREYHFDAQGVATTLVFRGAGDALIVVSPGNGTEAAALDELSEFGEVKALVASNGFHHLGQAAWRARFPKARSFAPKTAIERIAKKTPGLAPFEPLEAAAPLAGGRATIADAPGFKAGNAFVTLRAESGAVWYPSDLLANIPRLPSNLVLRMLMSMSDSAPGYKLFKPAVWLMVKDKRQVRDWAEQEVARQPLSAVVPAHGTPLTGATLVDRTKALLAGLG